MLAAILLMLTSPWAVPADEQPAAAATAVAPETPKDATKDRPDAAAASVAALILYGDKASPVTSGFLAVDFGSQRPGAGGNVRTVIVESPTAIKLDIRANGDFSVSPGRCDLAAKGSCSLSVSFAPAHAGEADGAVTVDDGAGRSRVIARLTGRGAERCDKVHWYACSADENPWPVLALVLVYWALLIAVRWNVIAIPSRKLLTAEIAAVRARFPDLTATPPADPQMAEIAKLLRQAEEENALTGLHPAHFSVLFWSRGSESMGWSLVHEAEELLVYSQTREQVRAALERSESWLRKNEVWGAPELADQIHAALDRTIVVIDDPYRSILTETQDLLHRMPAAVRTTVAARMQPSIPGPTAADYAAFSVAWTAAFEPQAQLLRDRIAALMLAPPQPSSPEFAMLVAHVEKVLLPQTAASIATVTSVAAAAAAAEATTPPGAMPPDPFPMAAAHLALVDATALRIQSALDAVSRVPIERWRALLCEALGLIYDRRDTDFATLVSWHNKTIWLIECGLLLILALAATLGHSVFFLLGATGGLLSRLSRTLYRSDVQTDYGASWTTLFLAPVIGAMAGWAGMLLASLLVKLNILGAVFNAITWENPYAEMAMAFAFVLGFSERLFDTILTQLQEKIVGKSTAAPTAASLAITTGETLAGATVGAAYSATLNASGGTSPYTWKTVVGSSLPAALSLGVTTGVLTGKASTAGVYKFTVEVKDKAGATSTKEFTLTVAAATVAAPPPA